MMRTRWSALTWLVVGCAASAAAQDGAAPPTALKVKATGEKTFYVDYQAGRNQVSFTSQSTLEDFTGVCNRVHGQFVLDPRRLESLRGRFSIRVEDMKTGIELRDEHMRSADWLDAANHPEVVIDVASVDQAKTGGDNAATMTLVGTCQIKGQSRAVHLPVDLTYLDESPTTQKQMKGDIVRLRSEFTLKLSDYGVVGPRGAEIIGLKVSDEIRIKVSIYAASEPPPKPLEADKPLDGGASQPARPQPPKRPGG